MTEEQIMAMLEEIDSNARDYDNDNYGLPPLYGVMLSEMASIVERHIDNAKPQSKTQYRIGALRFDGNATLDEIYERLEAGAVVSIDKSKTIEDFYNEFIENDIFSVDDALTAIRALLVNRKINAIKLVRHVTNWGLKESKEFVENNL